MRGVLRLPAPLPQLGIVMERFSRLASYIRWPGWASSREEARRRKQREQEEAERRRREQQQQQQLMRGYCESACEATARLLLAMRGVLLWESNCNSAAVVAIFNVLFWGFVLLEVRGFAAASSAALVMVISFGILETQEEEVPSSETSQTKAKQLEMMVKRVKSAFDNIVHLQQEQPRTFCTALCVASMTLWIILRNLDNVLLTYMICMSILLGPAILIRPCKEFLSKEWDNEIEDFLPAVTEDSFQVLKRAGEHGDRSPTPPSSKLDHFNDEDLLDLRMPSHEDGGSTDGLDLSEIELSSGEAVIKGLRYQKGHFERGSSSSDDDVDLGIESKKFFGDADFDDDSDDSEFEIIDSCEVASVKDV